MSIFNKIKERKAAKEAAIAEEARLAQVKDKCEKDFESYKMLTMATQAKIDTVETRTIQEDQRRINATIAYTQYGPVIKREVFTPLENGSYYHKPNYTTYEGYIKSGENAEALSGYFKINHRQTEHPNPIYRETYYFQHYKVINRNALGEVKEFSDDIEEYGHAGVYGNIVKEFENSIKELQNKAISAQQENLK